MIATCNMLGIMTRLHSRLLTILALPLGIASAHAAPPPATPADLTPRLGQVRLFSDWAVGCDNQLRCAAISLAPQDKTPPSYAILIAITRTAGPDGAVQVRFDSAKAQRGKLDIVAGDARVVRFKLRDKLAELDGAKGLALIRALTSSYAVRIEHKHKLIEAPSLDGLPAALQYMDAQQGRVGTLTALAAPGTRPDALATPRPGTVTFPAPPAVPRSASKVTLTASQLENARHLAVCDGLTHQHAAPTIERLGLDKLLVLLPCDAGAENVSNAPVIGTRESSGWIFTAARFDYMPGASGAANAPSLIVNPRWDAARGELSSRAHGGPLGDCGMSETYRWDGRLFRLVEARTMPVCRGAWVWPVIWHAEAAVEHAANTDSNPGSR